MTPLLPHTPRDLADDDLDAKKFVPQLFVLTELVLSGTVLVCFRMRRAAVRPNHHHSPGVRHPPAMDTTDSTKPRDAHTRGKLCTSV